MEIRERRKTAEFSAIVRSVLGLGRGLGLPVLAEGVETDAELGFLVAEHWQAAQVYLMCWPALIGQFARHTHGTIPVTNEDRKRA